MVDEEEENGLRCVPGDYLILGHCYWLHYTAPVLVELTTPFANSRLACFSWSFGNRNPFIGKHIRLKRGAMWFKC